MSFKFSGVIAKTLSVAAEVKSAIAKAASNVDGVVGAVATDAPEVEAVANLVVPGAGTYVNLGVTALEQLTSLLDGGNIAVEQNLLNAGLDANFLTQVKAEIANLEKLV
jgi:hypothetical protein